MKNSKIGWKLSQIEGRGEEVSSSTYYITMNQICNRRREYMTNWKKYVFTDINTLVESLRDSNQ